MKRKQKNNYPSFWKSMAVVMVILLINGALKHYSGLGKNNSAEKTIAEYAAKNGYTLDDYPKEIREMLVLNDETEEFVTQYPAKVVNFKPEALDFSKYKNCTTPPRLMQWDVRWGYMKYNGGVFGLTGSAPTCLSMAALYVLHNTSMTPVHIAEFAIGGGCENQPEKLLSDGARALGMSVAEVPRNNRRIREAVTEDNCTVICMTKSQDLSPFIVIKGVDKDGNYLINDPSSKKRSNESYTFADLNKSIKRIWKYAPMSSQSNP
ncbi:MAG: hypothetical protein IJM51_04625 [Clostridia bacterium]|nr:hypothetical protein [Clostridia bacterium]